MSNKETDRPDRNETATIDLHDRIALLEDENTRLRGVLEDGCDLGLGPEECNEALSKCKNWSS